MVRIIKNIEFGKEQHPALSRLLKSELTDARIGRIACPVIASLHDCDCHSSHHINKVRPYYLTTAWVFAFVLGMKYRTKIRVLGVGASYYHVMSRITERRFYLGAREKEHFRGMMRRVAEFSGVEVLTYSVLDNHFHLLIQVPERVDISDAELLRRMRLIYREGEVTQFERELMSVDEIDAERMRKRYLYRMYDLSEFMKTLKQRFAIWYNAEHGRTGHLWDDRFKSVLVEGGGGLDRPGVLWVMAQYIELNAVRAGIVKEAQAYRWCGLGEAVGGGAEARRGICGVFREEVGWDTVYGVYCGAVGDGLFLAQYRVRYFVDGVIFGTRSFVEGMFQKRRHLFCENRKTAARKMRGGDWGGLCTVRDFRKRVIEKS